MSYKGIKLIRQGQGFSLSLPHFQWTTSLALALLDCEPEHKLPVFAYTIVQRLVTIRDALSHLYAPLRTFKGVDGD